MTLHNSKMSCCGALWLRHSLMLLTSTSCLVTHVCHTRSAVSGCVRCSALQLFPHSRLPTSLTELCDGVSYLVLSARPTTQWHNSGSASFRSLRWVVCCLASKRILLCCSDSSGSTHVRRTCFQKKIYTYTQSTFSHEIDLSASSDASLIKGITVSRYLRTYLWSGLHTWHILAAPSSPKFSEEQQHPASTGNTKDYQFLSSGQLGFWLRHFFFSTIYLVPPRKKVSSPKQTDNWGTKLKRHRPPCWLCEG